MSIEESLNNLINKGYEDDDKYDNEIEIYCADELEPRQQTDICIWWISHVGKYPKLSLIALEFLHIPLSTIED
jgi:hypothetical protein